MGQIGWEIPFGGHFIVNYSLKANFKLFSPKHRRSIAELRRFRLRTHCLELLFSTFKLEIRNPGPETVSFFLENNSAMENWKCCDPKAHPYVTTRHLTYRLSEAAERPFSVRDEKKRTEQKTKKS
jgi:hypothetical protein